MRIKPAARSADLPHVSSLFHHPCAPRLSAQAGFTLVEAMIVVLVLSIVAALAVPMLHGTDFTRLKEAAHLLAADLAFAQNESITHGDDLRLVVFDTTNHRYHIATESDPATPIDHPVGGQPYRITYGEGNARQLENVTLNALSVNGDSGSTADRLGFGLYGQLDQPTDATITLGCGGATIIVTLDASTGEATVSELN